MVTDQPQDLNGMLELTSMDTVAVAFNDTYALISLEYFPQAGATRYHLCIVAVYCGDFLFLVRKADALM